MSDPIVWPTEPPLAGASGAGPELGTEPATPEPSPALDQTPSPPVDGRRPVASPWTRLGALAIEAVLMACTFGFGWVGWWIVSWADGQSPSKAILHLHVVRARDGTLASFGRMAVREAGAKAPAGLVLAAGVYLGQPLLVALAVVYVVVGAALASTDPRRRMLWDRVAGTVVLDGDPPLVPTAPPAAAAEAASPSPAVMPPAEAGTALG